MLGPKSINVAISDPPGRKQKADPSEYTLGGGLGRGGGGGGGGGEEGVFKKPSFPPSFYQTEAESSL